MPFQARYPLGPCGTGHRHPQGHHSPLRHPGADQHTPGGSLVCAEELPRLVFSPTLAGGCLRPDSLYHPRSGHRPAPLLSLVRYGETISAQRLTLDVSCRHGGRFVVSPTPVNWLVISPTFSCGWARYITHTPFVISPTPENSEASNGKAFRAIFTVVTRARDS